MADLQAYVPPKEHPLLKYFAHDHLAPHLQAAARPFAFLASLLGKAEVTDEDQRTLALTKLLEAKDCFLRSCLMVNPMGCCGGKDKNCCEGDEK